jgi:hypothetical protein
MKSHICSRSGADFFNVFRRNIRFRLPLLCRREARRFGMTKVFLGAAAGAALLALSAVNASAAVVCNGNVCWHTHERYTYPRSAGIVIHEDDWRPGPSITFREHEGRGYWHGDRWTDF